MLSMEIRNEMKLIVLRYINKEVYLIRQCMNNWLKTEWEANLESTSFLFLALSLDMFRMNPFPQKKIMTFNKHIKDFSFFVNYQVKISLISPLSCLSFP